MVRGLKNFSQKPPKSFRFWYRGTRDDVYYRLRGVYLLAIAYESVKQVGDGSSKHLGTVLFCLIRCAVSEFNQTKKNRPSRYTYGIPMTH